MSNELVPYENIIPDKIHIINDIPVVLDEDLAELYGVKTKSLNLAVKRNIDRFPKDFRFHLTKKEYENLKFQNETSKKRGGRRYLPYAFTEHGILMAANVLRSPKAFEVSKKIIRIFQDGCTGWGTLCASIMNLKKGRYLFLNQSRRIH